LPHSIKDYDNTCPICKYKARWFVVFQYEITTYDSKRFIYHIHFRNINNIQQRCHIIHMNFFMMFHLMGSTVIVWRVIQMNHIHALKSFHLLGFISSTTWIMGEDPSSYAPYMKMLSPQGFILHIISVKWNFNDDDSLELL